MTSLTVVLILTFISQVSRMDYTEISVDPKFHRHLIGKGGVNSKCRYYVAVMFPSKLNASMITLLRNQSDLFHQM